MPRGGKRIGSGNKFKWHHGETVTIRVPIALVDRVIEITQGLDRGLSFVEEKEAQKTATIDYDTQSKVVDLSGVSVRHTNGVLSVYLEDLARSGYRFKPDRLNDLVRARLQKLEIDELIKHGNNQKR
jgi:hypothetical protein